MNITRIPRDAWAAGGLSLRLEHHNRSLNLLHCALRMDNLLEDLHCQGMRV